MIKDYTNFLMMMEELRLFWINFNNSCTIGSKINLFHCLVKSKYFWPIIVIIHYKYIILANDRIQRE